MLDNILKFDAELLHKELQKPECRAVIAEYAQNALNFYDRYVIKAGFSCSLVQSALKAIWAIGMEKNAESISESLKTGNWGD